MMMRRRVACRTARFGLPLACGALLALAAASCGTQTTQPPMPRPFPTFALVDVNPHTPSTGRIVSQDTLSGPAAVLYFGWAT